MGLFLLFLLAFISLTLFGVITMAWSVLRPERRSFGSALARGYPTTPKDVGLVGEEKTFKLTGGATTLGFVIEGHKKEGPLAFIFHGHASSRFSALARAPFLVPFCSQVVCFDWRGHGDAAGVGGKMCDFGAHAGEDVLAVASQLKMQNKPLILMGCSMGSECAMRAALAKGLQERVSALILDGAYRHWRTGVRNRLAKRHKPVFFFFLVAAVVEWFLPHLKKEDMADYALGIHCPILFLHGSADDACPIAATQHVAECIPHGKAEFVVFHGAGHLGLHRAEPDKFKKAIDDFLSSNTHHPYLAQ